MSTTLHAAWARIGGGFSVPPTSRRVDPETLIEGTLGAAPRDPRLFWVAAGWLAVHHTLVNPRRLARRLADADEAILAVGGALFSLARTHAAAPATQLDSILRHCRPLQRPRALFDAMQENPVLLAKVREGALPEFARWGVWQDDVSLRMDAVRPVSWLLAHAPEFRSRALFGANAEAEVLDLLLALPATVQDMAEILGMTYAAVHEAASRLVARGWLRRAREGRRQVLRVSEELRGWIEAFPGKAAAA